MKRLTSNLSIFASNGGNRNDIPAKSSSKSFKPDGVVGLGIVAAMNDFDPFFHAKSSRAAILAVSSPRSTPIRIFSNASGLLAPGSPQKVWNGAVEDEIELSEAYTCVISQVGNNLMKKREYIGDVLAHESDWVSSESVFAGGHEIGTSMAISSVADFLDSCNMCKKQLLGLDIFMYRGEKAFCSAECRSKHISSSTNEKTKEKCIYSGAMIKPMECCSISPCSSPMQIFAGLAAA